MVKAALALAGLLGWLLCILTPTCAQQYAGQTIQNSLNGTEGAEIAFWNIKDAAGGDTTLINYASLSTSGQRPDNSKVKRAVIVIHGALRNADAYFKSAFDSLTKATTVDGNVNRDSVIIVAPRFASGKDKNIVFPFTEGQPAGQGSTTNALVYADNSWSNGARNIYPHAQRSISAYDALDQMMQYFDDKTRFPNLNQIVVAGHSLGAQTTQRYAVVGKELFLKTPHVYWIGNPNSFVWLNSSRPADTSQCAIYDNWREGLQNYTNQYERDFVQGGREAGDVLARWKNRQIAFARGLDDFGDGSSDCAPFTTGNNRGERFLNFQRFFPADAQDTVDYEPGIGHSHPQMIGSQSGMTRIFLDNFYGDNKRKADFGPRQLGTDNPHPVDSAVSPPPPLAPPPPRTTTNPTSTKGNKPSKTGSSSGQVSPSERRKTNIILGASIGGGLFLLFIFIAICLFFCVRRRRILQNERGERLYDEEGKRLSKSAPLPTPSPWSSTTTVGSKVKNKIRRFGELAHVKRKASEVTIVNLPEKPPIAARRGIGPPPDPRVWRLVPAEGNRRSRPPTTMTETSGLSPK